MLILLSVLSGRPAEVLINEFMASNLSVAPDNADFEDYSDWIELHNPASTNVSLANYCLTDDLTEPFKWLIPSNAVVPANGYLMIRADGHDAAPGETRLRGYWPWMSTFVTRRFHANFKLSADGEAIGLYRLTQPPQNGTLVAEGTVWKYRDTGTDPGTTWMQNAYDDSTWAQGPAQLGYGDGDEATLIGFGPDANNKYPTTHFRGHFNVTNPARLGNIRFRVIVDDGAVLYLNGTEFARVRMPTGAVTYTNFASAGPATENAFETVQLPQSLLIPGDNVLAVEVHQVAGNSSDLSWDAELTALEIAGTPVLVDSVTFGVQATDISYGRNATNGWSSFGSPTPENPNTTEPLTQLSPAAAVSASLASGFYTNAQSVTLGSGAGVSIRYTLDGSVPDVTAPVYPGALVITNNTILRARAFVSGMIPGPILTRSYFIDEAPDRTLPIMSIVADPATLFDSVIGIYTNDTPYAYKGREIPVRVEFFETNRAPGFAVNAGIRIGGENIWRFSEKPLNIHMNGKYGDDIISYPVFPEAVGAYGELNVRNGGDDWPLAMLRDALVPPVLRGQTENDLSSYRPTVVFLNGRYWGIYDIRKQFDPVFFANEHQLAEGTYDLVEYAFQYQDTNLPRLALEANAGTVDNYEAFDAFYTTHAMSEPTNYDALLAQMNVDSFIDYVVANDFGMNTSWDHNREFWRAHAPGSKWQWNVPDLDRCFDSPNLTGSLIDDFRNGYSLFQALDNNTNFVNRLLQRYAAHLGSTFYSNRFNAIFDSLSAEVDNEMPRHIARWAAEGGIPSLASRQAQLDEIKQFVATRPSYALSQLQTQLGLNRGMANLQVVLSPSNGGNLRIAGVPMTPKYNTNIGLFKNTPVELTAKPAPGFAFVSWSNGSTNPVITLTLTGNQSITANFQPGAETLLPGTIASSTTLASTNIPYTVAGDLIVQSNVTLTINPGVKFLMPSEASIYVYGALQVNGTSNNPVQILARDSSRPWGNLSFVNATGSSVLSNLIIRGASASRLDPVNLKAAVSAFNSVLTLDHANIEANLPIFARSGSTTLRNSRIHVFFTGDGINIKSGAGLVENCTFTGEATPDTDAIDFDGVTNGIIRGNRIYAFLGFNSDAVDVGENCQNLFVISNRIFNMFDKGVSVGQASVAHIERNLIVNCGMGVGVKDFGSTAWIDQNTFARDDVGVAVYEKNVGHGGGIAYVSNSIFYRSKDAPATVDSLSVLSVSYSMSDTLPIAGAANLFADPLFTDAGFYDFSLASNSPAINSGDPTHALDPDGSRADMGAYYTYDPDDYPNMVPNIIVVNEVLAHSHDTAPDWIELFNSSAHELNIGGWYLSDDPDVPMKYRITDGTILPGNGYLVFNEDTNFGIGSSDPGALIPFGLSENGDTVNIFGPSNGLRPDYTEKEDFGASEPGVTFGRYFKKSTHTFNFISMLAPTPGAANSAPLVGPVVISEIMYHPPVSDAEYIELVNITTNPVTLFDTNTATPWKITQGVTYTFPANPPLTLAADEKILLIRNSTIFAQTYIPPPGTRLLQWTAGALDNGGETVEISKPGDTNSAGIRQFIRVDRVDYSDVAPWPANPDGSGDSLSRITESAYGNDVANWAAATPTPGETYFAPLTGFFKWAADSNLLDGEAGPNADPDNDKIPNLLEYVYGLSPTLPDTPPRPVIQKVSGNFEIIIHLAASFDGVIVTLEQSSVLTPESWQSVSGAVLEPDAPGQRLRVTVPAGDHMFFRLRVELAN